MRGTILGYDNMTGEGMVRDDADNRYRFHGSAWRAQGGPPVPGSMVDFQVRDGIAQDIVPAHGAMGGHGQSGYGQGNYGQPGYGQGGYGMGGYGQTEAAKKALTYGIISLVCSLVSMVLGILGFITIIPAIIFGYKAVKLGKHQQDKTGYYLGLAGLILGIIGVFLLLIVVVLGIAFFSALGTAGALSY
jgi:hypothetical protein